MNKKSIQKIHSSLKNLEKTQPTNKKFSFKFESNFLNYQSHLRDFSSEHYKIFDQLYTELDIRRSIDDLFAGREVNNTEKRAALHHQYRTLIALFLFVQYLSGERCNPPRRLGSASADRSRC
mgnify:CR=1 FL=1